MHHRCVWNNLVTRWTADLPGNRSGWSRSVSAERTSHRVEEIAVIGCSKTMMMSWFVMQENHDDVTGLSIHYVGFGGVDFISRPVFRFIFQA